MRIIAIAVAFSLLAATAACAHGAHGTFAAGALGDPAKPARTVDLAIHEKLGEQVRFVVRNDGKAPHEFRLDSTGGNAAHKAMMAQMPDMTHRDGNAVTLAPGATGTLVWRFSKPGTYEFACLLPGHYEAGMHGTIVVAQ